MKIALHIGMTTNDEIDYLAFHMDNCRMCRSQRCLGDHEAINMCSKNLNSDYAKITKQIAEWPNWKKQIYNDNFAIGAHSKKLIIGDENMPSNMGGIGFTNMGAIGGSGSMPTIVVDGTKFKSDNNCGTCANKGICKYISYYASLIESVKQISVDSNFELRLWCKSYKPDTTVRG